MKTILKQLLPAFAVLFFCTVATAQSLEELATMQSELQNFVTVGTAKINDANATANMTAQELADLQAEINTAQDKLTAIAPMLSDLYAIALRDREEQIAAEALAAQQAADLAQAPAKAAIEAQYLADQAAEAQAIADRQAAYDAEQAAITAKLAVAANPTRHAPSADPNVPNMPPPFVSTGVPQQDADIIRGWLLQHGFILP